MPWKLAAGAAILIGICAGALIYINGSERQDAQPPQARRAPETPSAPAAPKSFFVRTDEPGAPPQEPFRDGKGGEVRLADFKGKPVLLNFWAPWCAPCVKELPSLVRLQQARPDIQIVAVNVDRPGGEPTAAFLAGVNAAALEAYSDPDRTLWRAYRLRGLPTTALIGADGVEIARKEGEAEWDSAEAQGEIDKALGK